MTLFAILTALAAVASAAASTVTVSDCSKGTSVFKVKSLDFSPVNAIPGQNGTLHSLYDVSVAVDAGTSKYSCTLNGLPVYSETFDLCTQTACPITAGTHDDYSTSQVPDSNGKVKCTIDWRDTANKQLLCIDMVILYSLRRISKNTTVYSPPALFIGTNLNDTYTCPQTDYDPLWPAVLSYEPMPIVQESKSLRGSISHALVPRTHKN